MRNPKWLNLCFLHLSLLALAIPVLVGCSKEEMNKMVEQVQSKTTAAVKETVAKIAPTGSVQIALDDGIDIPSCSVRLLSMGAGRANVVQIRSYRDESSDQPQSFLFQGTTAANSVKELVGATVTGQLFAQSNRELGLWQSDSESPASIKFLSIQETELFAEINQSQMLRVDGKSALPSGAIKAIIEKP